MKLLNCVFTIPICWAFQTMASYKLMVIPAPCLEAREWVNTGVHDTTCFEDVFYEFWNGSYFMPVTRKCTGQKMTIFSSLSRVASSTFTEQCGHCCAFPWLILSSPKEMLHPLSNSFPSPSLPHSRCLLSLLCCVCQLQHLMLSCRVCPLMTGVFHSEFLKTFHAAAFIRTTHSPPLYGRILFHSVLLGVLNLAWTQSLMTDCKLTESVAGDMN